MATIIAAFCVGLFCNVLSIFTQIASIVPMIAGILFLLPGGLSVTGFFTLMKGDYISGIAFGFQVVVTAISITIGIFLANLVIPPRHDRTFSISYL
jgi:uncharacterized membrane protein YjjB (DUF3815 family)